MAVALAVSFLGGCAVGLNQATETKVEEFKVEIQKLNANLESYKKEVQMLNDSFDKIAKYIRKFWEELHPEDK